MSAAAFEAKIRGYFPVVGSSTFSFYRVEGPQKTLQELPSDVRTPLAIKQRRRILLGRSALYIIPDEVAINIRSCTPFILFSLKSALSIGQRVCLKYESVYLQLLRNEINTIGLFSFKNKLLSIIFSFIYYVIETT